MFFKHISTKLCPSLYVMLLDVYKLYLMRLKKRKDHTDNDAEASHQVISELRRSELLYVY